VQHQYPALKGLALIGQVYWSEVGFQKIPQSYDPYLETLSLVRSAPQ
jgi:hypothetical protein